MRPALSAIPLVFALLACSGPREPENVTRELGSDRFSFGTRVELTEPAKGDVLAAGEEVAILARVPGDTLAAGGRLELRGPFDADVYAAAGRVNLDGAVAGSLRLAGGTVQLGPEASVHGGVSIAGGDAEVRGTLHDYLQVTAGTTHLEASVAGDVEVSGGSLDVGPGADIQGSLTFHGANPPVISPQARVSGTVRHIPEEQPESPWPRPGLNLGWALGLALLGAAGWAYLPKLSRSVVQIASNETASALAVGACLLFGVPVAALLAFFTILGAPLAVVSLALYALSLPLGYVVSALALSDRLWKRWQPATEPRASYRFLTLAIVLLLIGLLRTVPVLGWAVLVLVLDVGLGSLALHAWRWYRGKHPHGPGKPESLPADELTAPPAEKQGAAG